MNNLTKEIKELNNRLDHFDDTDPNYISPRIAQLTQRIIVTHARMESAVNFFMVLGLEKDLSKYLPKNVLTMHSIHLRLFIQECKMSFEQKIKYLLKNNSIPEEIAKKAKGVNSLRNKFAHPSKNYNELKKYDSSRMIKNILKLLVNVREEMMEYFAFNARVAEEIRKKEK